MTTIDTLSLDTVTGGIADPIIGLRQVKLLDASPYQIAQAKVFGGLKLPSRALIRQVSKITF